MSTKTFEDRGRDTARKQLPADRAMVRLAQRGDLDAQAYMRGYQSANGNPWAGAEKNMARRAGEEDEKEAARLTREYEARIGFDRRGR